MWSGDVINAQYYLPEGTGPEILRYWFPADGKGLVDNDLMVMLRGGKNPVLAHLFINHMLDPKSPSRTSAHRLPAAAELDQPRLAGLQRLRPAEPEDGGRQARVLRRGLPAAGADPANDAAWHKVWQAFKAGGGA